MEKYKQSQIKKMTSKQKYAVAFIKNNRDCWRYISSYKILKCYENCPVKLKGQMFGLRSATNWVLLWEISVQSFLSRDQDSNKQ